MTGGRSRIGIFYLFSFQLAVGSCFLFAPSRCTVRLPLQGQSHPSSTELQAKHWEGDDIRWTKRIRRRFSGTKARKDPTPCRNTLIVTSVAVFAYQFINAVSFIRQKHASYWPQEAVDIAMDALFGASIMGPLTNDFVHSPVLSKRQPHRYLTAGFLHGGLIHLVVNMDALRRCPAWLETGLGWLLYLTTFVAGIIGGNLWHTWSTLDNSLCLGASGGICALYGLTFTSLVRMGNTRAGGRVLRDMGVVLVYGALLETISNAAHIGGFLAGTVLGIICGPGYRKSYAMRRKNSLEVDLAPSDFREVMGFGKVSTKKGLVSLWAVWVLALVALASQHVYQRIPFLIYQGLRHPGSLSNMRV